MAVKMLRLSCLLLIQIAIGQVENDSIKIQLQLNFNDQPLVFDKKYISNNKDTLTFETIKFYLSSLELVHKDLTLCKELDSYHLIDFEIPESMFFFMKQNSKKKLKAIKFNIGIDSLVNVSGAMNGDLDASKAMYWSWQSGFINLKMEGKSSSCKTRKNQFKFHVGGYLNPNCALRTIEIPIINEDRKVIILNVNLAKLFDQIDLKILNTVMIPNEKAMKIADYSKNMFIIK